MSSRYVCRLLAGLAAGGIAIPDASAQTYLGAGVSSLSLASQYSAIGTRGTSGFTMIGGIEFAAGWFVEVAASVAGGIETGPTENIYYPADTADYGIVRLSIGKHFWPIAERGWTPWAAAGRASHQIYWNTFAYEVSGSGLSLGAGVDFQPAPPWRVRLQAIRHRFSAHDTYGYGPYSGRTNEVSAAAIYSFR